MGKINFGPLKGFWVKIFKGLLAYMRLFWRCISVYGLAYSWTMVLQNILLESYMIHIESYMILIESYMIKGKSYMILIESYMIVLDYFIVINI